jgi:23S rRNA (adenine1618-N6)-methyltransferase
MSVAPSGAKPGLHPRNRFRQGYDFPELVRVSPELTPFVKPTAHGDLSIDYADAAAVKSLNQALLRYAYALKTWDLPPGRLCPPVPGRADYVHHLADLLSGGDEAKIPRGKAVRVLDIVTGASAIYPLIGACEYGWSFVGVDIDAAALRWARQIVEANAGVALRIQFRQQADPAGCFDGVVRGGETFDLSLCNPPFHASAAEAEAGTVRKLRHLGIRDAKLERNFGGQANELWCPGGELAFIRRMIEQSARIPERCWWFTTLVSKGEHLPALRSALRTAGAVEVRVIEMAQGQKKSRVLAWTYRS